MADSLAGVGFNSGFLGFHGLSDSSLVSLSGASAPHLLMVNGVTKAFGGLTAVNNVTLQVAAGSLTALIGDRKSVV